LAKLFDRKESDIERIIRDLDHALTRTRWEGRTRRIVDRTWEKEKRRLLKLGDQARDIGKFVNGKRAALEQADLTGSEHLNGLRPIYEEFVKGMIALPVVGLSPIRIGYPHLPPDEIRKGYDEAIDKLEDALARERELADKALAELEKWEKELKDLQDTQGMRDVQKATVIVEKWGIEVEPLKSIMIWRLTVLDDLMDVIGITALKELFSKEGLSYESQGTVIFESLGVLFAEEGLAGIAKIWSAIVEANEIGEVAGHFWLSQMRKSTANAAFNEYMQAVEQREASEKLVQYYQTQLP
jgi:hypothetical protein